MTDDHKKPVTQPSMPAQPATVQLPKVDIASLLTSLSADMKQVISTGEKMSNDVDMLISDGRKTNLRLTRVEERIDEFDARLTRTSGRVKEPSTHDLKTEARLASEIESREALAKKVDIIESKTDTQTAMLTTISGAVTGVKGFIEKNPKFFATIIGIAGWVFSQIYSFIQARGH